MSPLSLKYPISVVILYVGGKSADVEELKYTVINIHDSLIKRGHVVRIVKVNKKNWRSAIHTPGQIYFNLVEDVTWELYQKVAWGLEKLGKAQVGHDKNMLTYGLDKKAMKAKLYNSNIPTPKYRVFFSSDKYLHHIRKMEYPLIVKPAGQHAGIGISQDSVVIDESEAKARINYLYNNYNGDVLVEEFIDGREVTVTVIGNSKHPIVLPIAELIFKGEYQSNWPIYSFNAKWNDDTWEYNDVRVKCPVEISNELEEKINKLAKKTFSVLKINDVARMDMRIDSKNNKVYVIDINPSPSLDNHEENGAYRSARALGWSYEDFIESIVAITYKRVFGKLPDRIVERRFLLAMPSQV